MTTIPEDEGAINSPHFQILENVTQEPVAPPQNEEKAKKKPSAPKRSSIEKTVDVSLSLCDKMEVDEETTNEDPVSNKLISVLEKEKSKHEDLYLLFKVYDKLKEAQVSNDNSLKNDIDIYKNDFLELKSFLQKKRKPKLDSTELIVEAAKEEVQGIPVTTDEQGQVEKDLMKEEKKSKKKIKAKKSKKIKEVTQLTPHMSTHSFEDINCGVDPLLNDKPLKSADKKTSHIDKEKNGSDKKKIVDKSNRSIMNFFQPKMKELPPKNRDMLNTNDPLSLYESSVLDAKKNNQFPLIYNNNIISYDTSTLPSIASEEMKSFYSIKGEDISKQSLSSYFSRLGLYFSSIKQQLHTVPIQLQKSVTPLKIIFNHDSFIQNKKISDKTSQKIKPKNPFIKDEYIIDYEKDSEEEFMEENAEDIKSNDNSSEENEEEEEQENNNEQWIVPDGHFSEDEISEKDVIQDRMIFEKYKPKMGSIMDILEIRKNFNKPIDICFNNNSLDQKNKRLLDKLSMKIFHFEDSNLKSNGNYPLVESEGNTDTNSSTFPIKIECKKTKANGVNNSIKTHFTDIIYHIHGSFETKEQLIIQLNESFKDISKKGLNNFFKEKCLKLKHNINGKKYWLVKHEILNELNLNQNEIAKLLETHLSVFNEKEKARLEEREINRQKNQIEQINNHINNNPDMANDNMNDVNMINQTAEIDSSTPNKKKNPSSSAKKRKTKVKKIDIEKLACSPNLKDNKKINDIFNLAQIGS